MGPLSYTLKWRAPLVGGGDRNEALQTAALWRHPEDKHRAPTQPGSHEKRKAPLIVGRRKISKAGVGMY